MTTIHLTLTIPEGATTCVGCQCRNWNPSGIWCDPFYGVKRNEEERPQECLDAERKAKND